MAAIIARSSASAAVSARRSQQPQQPKRSVAAAAWQEAITEAELEKADGQRTVCEVGGDKIIVAKAGGKVYAVSNKCPHLGLPLVGKTKFLQGVVGEVSGKSCITCPAHGSVFALEDGSVQGEWCPKLPNLPLIGKGPAASALKTFSSRVEDGVVEVDR